MVLPVPATVSISSQEPRTALLVASVTTCSTDGVCPSGAQPSTTLSQARRPVPLEASTMSCGVRVAVTLPANAAFAVRCAATAVTDGVTLSRSGASRLLEVPA